MSYGKFQQRVIERARKQYKGRRGLWLGNVQTEDECRRNPDQAVTALLLDNESWDRVWLGSRR